MSSAPLPVRISLQNIKPLPLVFLALHLSPFPTRTRESRSPIRRGKQGQLSRQGNGALQPRLRGRLRRPRGRLLRPLRHPSEAGGLAEAAGAHVLRPLRRRRRAPRPPPLPRHLLPLPQAPLRQQRHLHVQVNSSTVLARSFEINPPFFLYKRPRDQE